MEQLNDRGEIEVKEPKKKERKRDYEIAGRIIRAKDIHSATRRYRMTMAEAQ